MQCETFCVTVTCVTENSALHTFSLTLGLLGNFNGGHDVKCFVAFSIVPVHILSHFVDFWKHDRTTLELYIFTPLLLS